VRDPEMRHGHKSASKRFNGHEAAIAVDIESQLIVRWRCWRAMLAIRKKALELVQQSERVAGAEVEESVGDCACGGGPTRRAFADEDRDVEAVETGGLENCKSDG
jgi:hypothetical protein